MQMTVLLAIAERAIRIDLETVLNRLESRD